jgi:hypothetical protein
MCALGEALYRKRARKSSVEKIAYMQESESKDFLPISCRTLDSGWGRGLLPSSVPQFSIGLLSKGGRSSLELLPA